MKIKARWISFAALICLVGLAFALLQDHPSDSSLENQFRNHPKEFEELYQMAIQDSHLWRVSDTWYREKDGKNHEVPTSELSADRWQKYRHFFKILHLQAGVSIEEGDVYFIRSTSGLAVSGSSKGFARIKNSPQVNDHKGNSGMSYRPIGGEWYIYEDAT